MPVATATRLDVRVPVGITAPEAVQKIPVGHGVG
jgi:hypothetical protein